MDAPERRDSAFRLSLFAKFCIAKSCVAKAVVLLLSLPLIASAAAAQDYGHMRVQFSHGAAWTDTSPRLNSTAPLPPGPARAGYGYAHNAESGAPQDRIRLKASSFNGM